MGAWPWSGLELVDRSFDLPRSRADRTRHPVELAQAVVDRAPDARRGERLELHPALGIEPLDGVDQPEYAGADEVARVDAGRQSGADAAGDELDERGIRDDEVITRRRAAAFEPALPLLRQVRIDVDDAHARGMSVPVGGPQPFAADVGVALRGRDVAVPEQLLDRAQVGATVEQVGGEAVAQRVRVRRRRRPPIDDAANVARGQSASALVAEQRRVRRAIGLLGQHLPTQREPALQRGGRRLRQRYAALLRSLAPDDDGTTGEVDRVAVEPAELADPEAGAVEQLEHRIVATMSPLRSRPSGRSGPSSS